MLGVLMFLMLYFLKVETSEHQSIGKISEWSKLALKLQDDKRIDDLLLYDPLVGKSKLELVDKYYEIAAKPVQGMYSFFC